MKYYMKNTLSPFLFDYHCMTLYFRAVKALLPPSYTVKERGKVTVKGKGEMITFWVESKANRIPPAKDEVSAQFTAQ